MKNYEIAKISHEIAIFEEMKGEKFKPRAYEKAALYIWSLSDDLVTIYKKGRISSLMELPGIGKSIAEKLSELIRTGELQYYEQLKSQIPVDVTALASIEGIGAKTVKVLYQELGITNIEQLETAAKQERIRKLPGFGEKSEEQILHGIEFFNKSHGERLDLREEYIKLAIENGCKLTIDSDAHDKSHLHFLKFGISQARRGWAEGKDVINTLPLEKFLKSLK